jgi:hypothetical protein
MTIKVGDTIPEGTFTVMGEKGPEAMTTAVLFSGKKSRFICSSGCLHSGLFRGSLARFCCSRR